MLFKAVSSRRLCSRSKASERRSTKVPTRLISNKAADAHAINSTNELGESESVPATFEGSATRFTAPIIKAWFAISANTRRVPAVIVIRELSPRTATASDAVANTIASATAATTKSRYQVTWSGGWSAAIPRQVMPAKPPPTRAPPIGAFHRAGQ